MTRCRPGIARVRAGTVPDQRRNTPLRYVLHRIRDTLALRRARDTSVFIRSQSELLHKLHLGKPAGMRHSWAQWWGHFGLVGAFGGQPMEATNDCAFKDLDLTHRGRCTRVGFSGIRA
jgi:hypothetical protein